MAGWLVGHSCYQPAMAEWMVGYSRNPTVLAARIGWMQANPTVHSIWKGGKPTGKTKIAHLEATEFVRRYLLYVLPDRFHRIRYYGLFANRFRAANLECCRALLSVPTPEPSEQGGGDGEPETWQQRLERLTGIDPTRCPVCKTGRLVYLETLPPQLARASPPSRAPP